MKEGGRRNPALVELILVVLFFALSAMVLVQVFVRAKTMSEESRARTEGLVVAQDIIEQVKADPGGLENIFPEDEGWIKGEGEDSYICGRTQDMEPAGGVTPSYEVRVLITREQEPAGTMCRIAVTIVRIRDSKTITELKTAEYVPDTEGNGV